MTPHRYRPIVEMVDARLPACGSTKVIAIDGPSGAGKTSVANRLGEIIGSPVLHLDDLYPGWHGLAAATEIVATILQDLAIAELPVVHRWDWEHHRPGGLLFVPSSPLLILDGVGSGAQNLRPYLSALIWIEAPAGVRKSRALARDGQTFMPYWDTWAEQEQRYVDTNQPRSHADLVLDTR